ncbi:hypothetical protein ACFV2U_03895 [Streptomyces sp. NPDC059697]|uniref:hypothetical protein n=1 Tax=Streptomyces sp. NPDC059697 TaxID=3346912 RepID=UPI0036B121ED
MLLRALDTAGGMRLWPLWQVERDWYRARHAGPAARPPSYGTRSYCKRPLRRSCAASLAEATALAVRDELPRHSPGTRTTSPNATRAASRRVSSW